VDRKPVRWAVLTLTEPGGPAYRLPLLYLPFLPEDGSGIQLTKRCDFIIV
jgi:hypothetical protein